MIKQTDKLKNNLPEFLIYLMDDNSNPLECKLVYGEKDRKDKLDSMLALNDVSHVVTLTLEDFLLVKKTNYAIVGKYI